MIKMKPNSLLKIALGLNISLSIGVLQAATVYNNGKKYDLPDKVEKQDIVQSIAPEVTPIPVQKLEKKPSKAHTLVIMPEELLKRPQLLQRAMQSALQAQNIPALKKLVPVYENFTQKNTELLAYAKGLIAFNQQDYVVAQQYFNQVVQIDKKAQVASFYEGICAYYNRDYARAKEVFSSFGDTSKFPPDVKQAITLFTKNINEISQLQHWEGVSIVYNPNINGAPQDHQINRNGSIYAFDDQIKDWGMTYQVGLAKRFALPKGFYLQPILNSQGTLYRKEHGYNLVDMSGSLGFGYANSKNDWTISPNVFKRFYGGDPYLFDWGVDLSWRHYWSPIVSTTLSFGYDNALYEKKTWLNGHTLRGGVSTRIQINPTLSLTTGLNYSSLNGTRDPEDSYDSLAYSLSLTKGFLNGFNTQFSSSLLWRKYHGKSLFTQGNNLYENNYNFSLSFWHNKLQWHGFAPKLVLSQDRQVGNNLVNNYVRNRATINIIKLF